MKQGKKKGAKKKIEMPKATFQRLTDDEKNDLVSQEVEMLQAEIDHVSVGADSLSLTGCPKLLKRCTRWR